MGSLQLAMAMGSVLPDGFCRSSIMGARLTELSSLSPAITSKYQNVVQMVVKRWERKEVKPNSLPVVKKTHVKIGDTVKVVSGADKGKIGEITQLYTHNSKILIKDVNLKTKHVKPKQEGETGQIIQIEAPIHSSNVMLYSKSEKVASRVGHKLLDDGRKVRYLIKTGEVLDSPEDWKRLHKDKKNEK